MKKWIVLMAAVAGAGLLVTSDATALTFADFESPTYTMDTDISGVDSWSEYGGTSGGLVTPGTTGYPALLGSQSFVAFGSGRLYVRPFVAPMVLTNDTEISWLFWQEGSAGVGNPGNNFVYLGDSVGGASPIAGVGGAPTDTFKLVGVGADTDSGVTLLRQKTYRLSMVLDFDNQEFDAYAENLTDSGPRTFLGTKGFALPLAAGPTTGAAPILGFTKTGGSAFVVDDFMVIPEPTSVALAGLGALFIARRLRKS